MFAIDSRTRRKSVGSVEPRLTLLCLLFLAVLLSLSVSPNALAAPSSESSLVGTEPFSLTAEQLLQSAEEGRVAAMRLEDGEAPPTFTLLSETRISVGDRGERTATLHTILVVDDPDDVASYVMEVAHSFSPWYQLRPRIRARVTNVDSKHTWLDPATLSERPAASGASDVYSDRKVLEGPLPAVGPGAVVEVEIISQDTAPFFSAGTVNSWTLGDYYPLLEGLVEIVHPDSIRLRTALVSTGPADERSAQSSAGYVRTLRYGPLPGWDGWENGLPGDVAAVDVFSYSTAPSWTKVAEDYSAVVDEVLAEAQAEQTLKDAPRFRGDPLQKATAAMNWIWDRVRYTGLELGEGSIIPVAPHRTLERGFGDCKDQSTLLVGLLRKSGLDAHLALLDSGTDWEVPANLPGLGSFDHAIVHVELGEDNSALWLDPTDPKTPAGFVPVGDQGRAALIARPGEDALVRIPVAPAKANLYRETIKVQLADYGVSRVASVGLYTGAMARRNVPYWEQLDEDELKEMLEQFASYVLLADQPDSVQLDVPDRDQLRAELSFSALSKRFVTDLDVAVAALVPGLLVGEAPSTLLEEVGQDGGRKHPFSIQFPRHYEVVYDVQAPPGTVLQEESETENVEGKAFEFSSTFQQLADNHVIVTYRLSFPQVRFEPEDFEQAREFLADLDQHGADVLVFEHKARALLRDGDALAAIAAHQELIKDHPDSAVEHVRLAATYLEVGMKQAALESVGRALDIDPDSALAHWQAGVIHLHDDAARRWKQGFDHDQALEHLAKAAELDPKSELFVSEYALALERDQEGLRLSPHADLEKALAIHLDQDSVIFEHGRLGINVLGLMARTGRFEEMLETDASELDAALGLKVAALALTKGVSRARQVARRETTDKAARASILLSASQLLLVIDRLDEANELMQAGIEGSASRELLAYAEMLDSASRALSSDIELPRDTPEQSIARRGMILFMRLAFGEDTLDELLALVSPEVLSRIDHDALDRFIGTIGDQLGVNGTGFVGELLRRTVVPSLSVTNLEQKATPLGTVITLHLLGEEMAVVVEETAEGPKIRDIGDLLPLQIADAERRLAEETRLSEWLDYSGRTFDRSVLLWGLRDGFEILAKAGVPGGQEAAPLARSMVEILRYSLRGTEESAGLREIRQSGDPSRLRAALAVLSADDRDDFAMLIANFHVGLSDLGSARAALDLVDAQAVSLGEESLLAHFGELEGDLWVLRASSLEDAELRQRTVTARLAANPRDQEALALGMELAFAEGDYSKAVEMLEQRRDSQGREFDGWNELAWARLYLEPPDPKSLEEAIRAVDQLSLYPTLHTLAAVYAELEQPYRAFRELKKALISAGKEGLGSPDYYVLGRIAEAYDLDRDARHFYRLSVEEEQALSADGRPPPHGSAALAQKGLERIGSSASNLKEK